jgi:hypothetical protein
VRGAGAGREEANQHLLSPMRDDSYQHDTCHADPDWGAIFKLSTAGKEKVLYSFCAGNLDAILNFSGNAPL